jgi:hypothetical protein
MNREATDTKVAAVQVQELDVRDPLCDYNGETTPADNLECKAEEKKHVTGIERQGQGRNAQHRSSG